MAGRLGGVTLASLLFVVYLAAPVHQIADSRYALLLGHSLVFDHSFALNRYFASPVDETRYPGVESGAVLPYHLVSVGHDRYYFFPLGGPLLGAPLVALARPFGLGPLSADGRYDAAAEERLDALLAAALMALWAWLVYETARRWLSVRTALIVASVAGLGTQALSTASRALWSDTWALVILQAVLLLLLRGRPRPVVIATMLAWLYLARPTHAVSILAVIAIVLVVQRRLFVPTALWGGGWLLVFVAFSLHYYGTPLPPYYLVSRLGTDTLGAGLLGNLVSPARGLLVYVPVTLFVAVALALRWRHVRERALVVVSALALAAYLVATSAFPTWWGGWSYGPRLMTGTLAWLVLLAIHAVRSLPPSGALRRALLSLAVATATASVLVNAVGAVAEASWRWNNTRLPSSPPGGNRLWDWRDPPFLRWRQPG